MATKKTKIEHTGFRNGLLFCFNCGGSHQIHYPAPVNVVTKTMGNFNKLHANCVKTWQEPVPEPEGKSIVQNIDWWLQNGEHGISSKTMVYAIAGKKLSDDIGHPHDVDDFSRCYKLLQAVPQFKKPLYLERMNVISPVWEKLVAHWQQLTTLYEAKQFTEMYELMKKIGC